MPICIYFPFQQLLCHHLVVPDILGWRILFVCGGRLLVACLILMPASMFVVLPRKECRLVALPILTDSPCTCFRFSSARVMAVLLLSFVWYTFFPSRQCRRVHSSARLQIYIYFSLMENIFSHYFNTGYARRALCFSTSWVPSLDARASFVLRACSLCIVPRFLSQMGPVGVEGASFSHPSLPWNILLLEHS